jgi:hypothetical protein
MARLSSSKAMSDVFDFSKAARFQDICCRAAEFVGAFSNVLDIGVARADFIQALPDGCDYRTIPPKNLTGPEDLWQVAFPDGRPADIITVFDLLDRLEKPDGFLRTLRAFGRPVVFSHSAKGAAAGRDLAGVRALMRVAGFWPLHHVEVGDGQRVFKAMPGVTLSPPPRIRKVLVLSYYNDPNFGDRLGFHVINGLLPAGVLVTHASVKPWTVPDEDFDLLILGIGNSLNAATILRPELHRLMEKAPHTIGIFGTQYRHQYRDLIAPKVMDRLLGNLTTWWARYEEDIAAFGRGRNNARHLGDFLISAFPLTTPTDHRTLLIKPDIKSKDVSLDRLIQEIQTYRRVSTARIHPMLCALTSAEEVAYREQQEDPLGRSSGKFRSQLYDVFGRTFEEDKFFAVDRPAVARYKQRVEANMSDLRAQISELLA